MWIWGVISILFEKTWPVPNQLWLQKQHSKPANIENRHVGDLGNIITPLERVTSVSVFDSIITLEDSENGITGKAFVIHAGEDDLGMGGDEGSLKTGNAGGRLACGIVEPLNYQKIKT